VSNIWCEENFEMFRVHIAINYIISKSPHMLGHGFVKWCNGASLSGEAVQISLKKVSRRQLAYRYKLLRQTMAQRVTSFLNVPQTASTGALVWAILGASTPPVRPCVPGSRGPDHRVPGSRGLTTWHGCVAWWNWSEPSRFETREQGVWFDSFFNPGNTDEWCGGMDSDGFESSDVTIYHNAKILSNTNTKQIFQIRIHVRILTQFIA
jgi:hypothetical protein